MRELKEIREDKRLEINKCAVNPKTGEFMGSGWVKVQKNKSAKWAYVIFGSDEAGLEHVSAHLKDRCLTWDEMCVVKKVFWRADEACIQLHPKQEEYVNIHETCLHIWRMKNAAEDWPFTGRA